MVLKGTVEVFFRMVKERLVRIHFLTFDSFTGIGGTKTEKEPVVSKWILVGKGEKRERECNVNGLRKERAMYVTRCHQM